MKKLKVLFLILLFAVVCNLNMQVKAVEQLPDDGARISSAQITQTKTGTGPWDADDEPGNDSSEDNNIVRSFDQVTWTIENTMVLNNTNSDGYNGGRIYFEAKLPDDVLTSELIRWDTESMGWVENPNISADGLTLSGYYQMGTSNLTIPGKQTLIFITKVEGAPNGTQFAPNIKLWLTGNQTNEYVTVVPDEVTVSAAPKYNIVFRGNTYWNQRVTVDFGNGEETGRMYGYQILAQLYNTNSSKELKGIEFPKGDITGKIKILLERTNKDTKVTEDITDSADIRLYNYKVNNGSDLYGMIPNRPMTFSSIYHSRFGYNIPSGSGTIQQIINSSKNVYNSGSILMNQLSTTELDYTLSNYKFCGYYPRYAAEQDSRGGFRYGYNVGCFGAYYFQLFVPENDATEETNYDYYLTLKDTDFNATSISNQETNIQQVTNDDTQKYTYIRRNPGSYSHRNYIMKRDTNTYIHSTYYNGDGVASIGDIVAYRMDSAFGKTNEDDVLSIDKLAKFDAEAFEPTQLNGKWFYQDSHFTYKNYFATKPDGTNWTSQTEMNNAEVEDLVLYDNYEDIPEGHLCVATFFESQSGCVDLPGDIYTYVNQYLKIKESATIGNTYAVTSTSRYWIVDLDRDVYTQSKLDGYDEYPKNAWHGSKFNYVKTEYDENGVQITGTHSGGHPYGNTALIIGARQKIQQIALDDNNVEKINYDLGRNENKIRYKVEPSVYTDNNGFNISDITIKVTDTLPKGLMYEPGSSNYGEPEITNNANGSTTLVWTINGVETNVKIDELYFNATIDENTINGTQYTNKVVISGDEKIGNTAISARTSEYTVQVINLASHRLFKSDVTPVIERNGTVHYTVSYKNGTDNEINNFQLLDVLPYNGDDRGTEFTGNYQIEKIELTQLDVDDNVISNNNLKIYYTNDESARNANSKDTDLANGWTEATTSNIMANGTAIAVKGKVLGQEKVNIDIYLKTNGNKGLDKYVNKASAQVYAETEEMVTSKVTTQVVLRTVEGIAWKDANANGIKDANEEIYKDVAVTLTDANGAQVTDVDGHTVTTINTDDNGYYKFTNLPMGNYLVKVAVADNTYMLTEKEVGSNATVNSKFNVASATTDEITKLNSIDLPELTQSNVNAGFVKKPTKVVVNYLEKGTTTKLLDEYTINGRIDDSYSTTNRLADVNAANANKYVYDSVDGEVSGTMVEDTIYITYYFVKKDTNVKVLHVEEGTDVTNPESVTDVLYNTETISGKVDDEYTTSNKLTEINASHTEQYDFVRSTTNTSGTMTVDTIYVIYEYKKAPAVVKVQHLEQGTNTPLQDEETLNGVVGLDYTTTNKLSEINAENANKYELVTPEPSNKNGTYAREEQTVTYYYQKKPTKVVVLHVEEGTDVTDPASVTDVLYPTEEITGRVDDAYNTSAKTDEINATTTAKYALVTTPTNANGSMTVDTIYVIYVYQKQDTSLLVKHIDVITGEELDSKTIEGYIGDKVTTQEGTFERYKLYEKPTTEEYTLTEEPQTVTYYYIKQADVVVEYLDEITGNYVAPYDRTTYTEREEYTTAPKTVADYTLTTDSGNTAGTVYRDDIFVKYYYKKNTSLVVKYVDYYTGEIISPTITMTGVQGQEYTTEQKEIPDYVYVEVIGKPNGQMDREPQEVIYRYKKQANLITEHIDINTGEKIIPDVIKKYMEKEEYEALGQNFPGYVLVQAPEQTKGIMEREDVTKTFYYKKISGGLIVKYVDVLSGELLDQVEYTGNEGDPVTFEEKSFIYYFLHSTPEVDNATLTVEPQEYIYYYIKMGSVNVIGIDQDTREELYRYNLNGVEGEKYEAYPRTLDGYKLVVIPNNEKGTYERNTPDVIYEYKKYSGTVDVEYIDKDTGELLGTDKMSGVIGESYKTEQRTYEGYRFVNVEGETIGTYSEEAKLVKYYYERKTGRVVVKYITEDGTELAREEDSGKVGESFHFTEKEFEEYEVVSRPDSLDGTYVEGLIELVIVLKPTDVLGEESGTIIVNFKDRQGNVLRQQVISQDLVGEEFYLEAPDIEGYTIVGDRIVKATYINGELVYDIIYEKIEEKPAEPIKETVDTGDINVVAMLIVLAVSACGITLVKKYKKD